MNGRRRMGPQVKICGVCQPEDAALASAAGASYVGVILAPGRRRSISVAQAEDVLDATTAQRVGVFVDETAARVLTIAQRLRLDVVQLHGGETSGFAALLATECRSQLWKAVAVHARRDVGYAAGIYAPSIDGLLLDGWSPAAPGGTGATFDWHEMAGVRADVPATMRLIIAGGLTPENVADAVRLLQPDVLDVSSGVEAVLRHKSPERVRAFIAAVRGAPRGEDEVHGV